MFSVHFRGPSCPPVRHERVEPRHARAEELESCGPVDDFSRAAARCQYLSSSACDGAFAASKRESKKKQKKRQCLRQGGSGGGGAVDASGLPEGRRRQRCQRCIETREEQLQRCRHGHKKKNGVSRAWVLVFGMHLVHVGGQEKGRVPVDPECAIPSLTRQRRALPSFFYAPTCRYSTDRGWEHDLFGVLDPTAWHCWVGADKERQRARRSEP